MDDLLLKQTTEGQLILNFLVNTDKNAVNKTVLGLQTRLELLETYWTKVLNRHGDLQPTEDQRATISYWKDDVFSSYEATYIQLKVTLNQRLATLLPLPTGVNTTTTQGLTVTTATAPPPKIPLPTFNGNQLQWDTFKERFTSMVINVASYSKVTKLQYLQSCVQGIPAKRLNNLEVTSANFDVAWAGLVKRYNNRRRRLSAQLSKVLSMPMTPQKTAEGISILLDEVDETLQALKSLGRPIDQWDDWLVEIVASRLDGPLREDWEKTLEGHDDFPKYEDLVNFLENRARTLETAQGSSATQSKSAQSNKNPRTLSSHHSSTANPLSNQPVKGRGSCVICQEEHYVTCCPTFTKAEAAKRFELVHSANLCYNCLSKKHSSAKCMSQVRCLVPGCGRKHHTMLHSNQLADNDEAGSNTGSSSTSSHSTQIGDSSNGSHENFPREEAITLLPTAWVIIESSSGTSAPIRALLDQASEGCFITERVVQMLSLNRQRSSITVLGVGGQANLTSNYTAEAILKSPKLPTFSLNFSAMVLRNLTKLLPKRTASPASSEHLKDLDLADDNFLEPGRVDCILGGDVFPSLLLSGVRLARQGLPAAQQTVMGWVVTGPAPPRHSLASPSTSFSFHTTFSLHDHFSISEDLRRFWEIEEIAPQPQPTQAERDCELHYIQTHRRDKDGRFVLRLPFKNPPKLGDSKRVAQARFLQNERRLLTKPAAKKAYSSFIGEMISLGHLEKVKDAQKSDVYFMPQHAVAKQDGSGKIKVVSNASQVTSNGRSLNDFLHTGPKLQADIVAILLKWRFFPVVFSTDIVKMFRQFLLDERDRDWLRILWRESPEQELAIYRMRTVVYGTACAPYQAIRSLHQLATEIATTSPRAAHILLHHMYMDDALSGADTLQEAILARDELIVSLRSAGMELDKWSANHPDLLQGLSTAPNAVRVFTEEDIVTTLGLQWNPTQDFFCYKVTLPLQVSKFTKRAMLSEIARLYDPLGWLAPAIIVGKILIQKLWITGCDWDQEVSEEVDNHWTTLRHQLPSLESLRIPRWVGTKSTCVFYLHGFADASSLAYAAAIYVVTQDEGNQHRSTLLVAKSKVAPIKTVSIPRLELCGAQLLARLMSSTLNQLPIKPEKVHCWLDSQVALAWLGSHPSRWTTFVANRVSDILTTLPNASWQHVRTDENPADLASRGAMPKIIHGHNLWWHGPSWLIDNYENWDTEKKSFTTASEERKETLSFLTPLEDPQENAVETIFKRFSRWTKLQRVIAVIIRWKKDPIRAKTPGHSSPLSAEELRAARQTIFAAIQRQHYSAEVSCLLAKRPLPSSSKLRRFLPFIDEDGLLRVGGRLQNTFLGEGEKHPIIVPCESHIAELLIRDAHQLTLHGGPQLVQSHLLRSYWIVRARNRIRRLTRQCVRCTRFQGLKQTQQMAALPSMRVTPARPFTRTGLDYAGPFQLRTTKGRGHKSYKGYICVFVCLVTRAVHLEVVSDLSSQAFLSAFRRFVARRGLCSELLSDNGTNFQGASSELQRLFNAATPFYQEAFEAMTTLGVSWKFIPPRAPHFGGLWEAAVKAFKHHLRRVLGDATLTYEEFSTLAAQVEACLNSRPLCPLSSDPMDLAALTPGHFLVGTALSTFPEPFEPLPNCSGVTRYHLVTDMRNHFWKRWQNEVLRLLQPRSKWLDPSDAVQVGDLVLVTDELQPPTKWPLARVLELHCGSDGLARVLTLQTASTTLRRPLVKVVRLPVDPELAASAATSSVPPPAPSTSPAMAGGPVSSS